MIISRSKATPKERLWNSGQDYYLHYYPEKPTRFDELVTKIGLAEKSVEYLVDSKKLRKFAEKNRRYFYVPEVLLRAWNLQTNESEC